MDRETVTNPDGSFLEGTQWQSRAEEELNESSEVFCRELDSLKRLVANDHNLIVPADDAFLLRFLRARKFDSKKAFHMLQRYYMMKLKCPELFGCPVPSECDKVLDLQAQNMVQQRDQSGRRVYIIRLDYFDSSRVTVDEIFRANVLALEHAVRDAETQVAGVVVLLDMAGLTLHHARFLTPYYARRMVDLVQETFPLRFKGFHVVNEPFFFDALMAVVKPFIKEKIRKRIFLHGSDLSSLHALVSSDVLPTEYGGSAGNFDNRVWYMQMLQEESYFKSLENYGYKVEQGEKTKFSKT